MNREDPRAQPAITALLTVLNRHQGRCILFGSAGAVAHGAALSPGDLDICPAPDPENLACLAAALRELAARPRHTPGWNTRQLCGAWTPSPLTPETF